jgi:hypothetical protein
MITYKTKNTIIEAIQFTGFNDKICLAFCLTAHIEPVDQKPKLIVTTPLGDMLCSMFDWIVRDEEGDFYVTQSDNKMWERYEEIQENTTIGEIKKFNVKPTTVNALQYNGENYKEAAMLMGCPQEALTDKKTLQQFFEGVGLENEVWLLIYPDGTMGLSKKESFEHQFEPIEPIANQ